MKIFFKIFLLFFLVLTNNNTICAMESGSDSDFSTQAFYSDDFESDSSDEIESISSEENFYLASIKSDSNSELSAKSFDSESSFESDSSDEYEYLVRDFVKSIKTLSPEKSIKKFSSIIKGLENIEVFSILYEALENKLKEYPKFYITELPNLNLTREHFIKKHIKRQKKLLYKFLEEIDNNTSITLEERKYQKAITIALNSFERNLIEYYSEIDPE